MFTALHALAQNSTLMIAISTDGEQLRVSITPTPADDKKKQALRPLSLVGTPEELDTGFAEAIAIWQAPKKSLAEQAKEAAEAPDDEDSTPSKAAVSKSSAKKPTTTKPATKAAVTNKAAAKPASTPVKKTPQATTKTAAKAAEKPSAKESAKAGKSSRTVLNPSAQWPFPRGEEGEDTPPAAGAPSAEEPSGDQHQEPSETAPAPATTADSAPAAEPETPPADAAETFTLELF